MVRCIASVTEYMMIQEVQQRIFMYCQLLIQSYQCIIGTLLLLFIPQLCGIDTEENQSYSVNRTAHAHAHACLFQEALMRDEAIHQLALVLNVVTFGCFCWLYVVEYIREECLIDYLDANPQCSTVGKEVITR